MVADREEGRLPGLVETSLDGSEGLQADNTRQSPASVSGGELY